MVLHSDTESTDDKRQHETNTMRVNRCEIVRDLSRAAACHWKSHQGLFWNYQNSRNKQTQLGCQHNRQSVDFLNAFMPKMNVYRADRVCQSIYARFNSRTAGQIFTKLDMSVMPFEDTLTS
jgi:hypothetical protein